MGLEIWTIGKTKESYLKEGIANYEKRLGRHIKIRTLELPDIKRAAGLRPAVVKEREAAVIQGRLDPKDHLVLLDEKGKTMASREFASFIDSRLQSSSQRTVFLIGGAYGFHPSVYDIADSVLSLSEMTFSHQLVRLIFWEQLYRAISILRGLPYHNG
jgi:23S rRNA (pseudouridine1915-N3)-methyltransferase